MSQSALIAAAGLLVAGGLLWLGRRDLTRPAVAFGVPWFAFAAMAQLRLTPLEGPWSTGFALTVLGGGLAFVAAATVAGGIAPARGTVTVDREAVRVRRLVTAAVVLVAAGLAGAAYKASVLDGIPLLSANPDEVRGRATAGGQVALPTWSSALTGGFYLGMWSALAALWALPRGAPRLKVAGLWALAGAALLGVALEASRNLVVFAIAVPLVAAYLFARPRRSAAQMAWIGAAVCVVALGVGGLFVLRLVHADNAARTYLQQELDRQPTALRPLVPVYINAVYPLEAARRMDDAVPGQVLYGVGANSLTSLPDAAFPEGKPLYGAMVSGLMETEADVELDWAVASYQGRLLADLGRIGVVLGSILLGLAFGSLHRWARARTGLLAVAVVAYVAYYSAYLLYDNHLSFTLIAVFDLAVIALVHAYSTGAVDERIGSLGRALTRRAAT